MNIEKIKQEIARRIDEEIKSSDFNLAEMERHLEDKKYYEREFLINHYIIMTLQELQAFINEEQLKEFEEYNNDLEVL